MESGDNSAAINQLAAGGGQTLEGSAPLALRFCYTQLRLALHFARCQAASSKAQASAERERHTASATGRHGATSLKRYRPAPPHPILQRLLAADLTLRAATSSPLADSAVPSVHSLRCGRCTRYQLLASESTSVDCIRRRALFRHLVAMSQDDDFDIGGGFDDDEGPEEMDELMEDDVAAYCGAKAAVRASERLKTAAPSCPDRTRPRTGQPRSG